jgi:hypothetical protein
MKAVLTCLEPGSSSQSTGLDIGSASPGGDVRPLRAAPRRLSIQETVVFVPARGARSEGGDQTACFARGRSAADREGSFGVMARQGRWQ